MKNEGNNKTMQGKKPSVAADEGVNMITWVNIIEESDMIQLEYHDGKKRWCRASGGFTNNESLSRHPNENKTDFLNRVKEHVWDKYLKPTEKRFGKLTK